MQLSTKLDFDHLVIRLLLFGALTCVIMRAVVPILIWIFTGDAGYPKDTEIYINIIARLSAIAILLPIVLYKIVVNYRNHVKLR